MVAGSLSATSVLSSTTLWQWPFPIPLSPSFYVLSVGPRPLLDDAPKGNLKIASHRAASFSLCFLVVPRCTLEVFLASLLCFLGHDIFSPASEGGNAAPRTSGKSRLPSRRGKGNGHFFKLRVRICHPAIVLVSSASASVDVYVKQ